MRKVVLLAFLMLLGGGVAQAQQTITAAGATCATTGACVIANTNSNSGSVSFTITGNGSGNTLQFEVAVGNNTPVPVTAYPPNSTTGVTSTTGNGTWTAAVAGMATFDVRCSAYVSGTPAVTLSVSTAISVSSLTAGGGGGGGFTAGGDLSGTSSSQRVVGILSNTLPSLSVGYLNWTGSAWAFSAVGSGTVGSCGTTNALAIYTGSTTTGCGNADFTYATHTFTAGSSGLVDFSAIVPTTGFKLPSAAGAVPTADGFLGFNTTTHTLVVGSNGTTIVEAAAATGTGTSTTCTNQFFTIISAVTSPTCTTATLASAQFANQGTTTTVLHGNAAGNPSWGAVNLSTDVSNQLPISAVGSSGLSGTSPITILAAGAIGCATCNTSNATVSSVSFTGGLISVGTPTTTPAFTVAGTSGGIPYFSSAATWASSGALTQYGVLFGGGAGGSPTSSAQGGSNFPLIGQGAANPIFSTIAYPTSLTSGGFLYASSTTGFASSALIAANVLPKSGGAGTAPLASSISDNGTTVATTEAVTGLSFAAGTSPPICAPGTAGAACFGEGTAPTAVSAVDDIWGDSTSHTFMAHANGGSAAMVVLALPTPIHSTGNTAAISTATLCAASAGACNQAGTYQVSWAFIEGGTACATPGTGGVTFLLTWTDSNGTAHSAVSLPMDDGSAVNAVSGTFHFQTSLAAAWASGNFNITSNGSIIQYATGYTACGVGTGNYTLDISVTRVR